MREINKKEKDTRDIRFDNDIAVLAEEEKDLRRMDKIMKAKGMKLNKKKTKIMVVCRYKNINPLDLMIRKIQIEKVNKFKYLGNKVAQDGRCKCEIRSRISQAQKIF